MIKYSNIFKILVKSILQQPFGDLAVLLPQDRKTDLLNPDQTNAMPAMFDEMVTRISRYQPYRKQVKS